mmetsp:Transcript_4300/g.8704  ORF Transcript_4300/g.8704 Transcript_4300/m.8704 type:complete len:85 (-) Transcript_4300:411-665(-)
MAPSFFHLCHTRDGKAGHEGQRDWHGGKSTRSVKLTVRSLQMTRVDILSAWQASSLQVVHLHLLAPAALAHSSLLQGFRKEPTA